MKEINFELRDVEAIDLTMGMGIKKVYPPIENLEVIPTKEQQVFTHDNSYGYDNVTVEPIPDEYIIPDGTLDVSENGDVDVTMFKRARVGVSADMSNYYTKEEVDEKLDRVNDDGGKTIKYHFYDELYVSGVGSTPISTTSETGQAILSAMQDAYNNRDKYNMACFIIHSTHVNGIRATTLKCYMDTSSLYNKMSPRVKSSATYEHYLTLNTPTITDGVVSYTGTNIGTVFTALAISTDNVLTKTNTTAFTPSSNYHPATKKYVDDAIASIEIPESGGSEETNGFDNIPLYRVPITLSYSNSDIYIRTTDENGPRLLSAMQHAYNNGATLFDIELVNTKTGSTYDSLENLRLRFTIENEAFKMSSSQVLTFWTGSSYAVIAPTYRNYMSIVDGVVTTTDSSSNLIKISGMVLTTQKHYIATRDQAQSITGSWTFSTIPSSSVAPTSDNHIVNKAYVDSAIANAITTALESEY